MPYCDSVDIGILDSSLIDVDGNSYISRYHSVGGVTFETLSLTTFVEYDDGTNNLTGHIGVDRNECGVDWTIDSTTLAI